MSAVDETHQSNTEPDQERHHPRRFRRPSVVGRASDVSRSDDDDSSDDNQSWHSRFGSKAGGGSQFSSDIEGLADLQRSFSESEVDLESGVLEMKVHSGKVDGRDCRICHLGLESESSDCGAPIELGCSCKGDLGSAHKHCAETWFKIKGDTTCEICGVTALNIAGERTTETNAAAVTAPSTAGAPVILVETIWHGRRIMNFLLACMVLAFVTSWLFHFKIL
ncbi:Zinc finger, RING-CH-type [Trema orientale]|uniref:Zinc finger, RING-CH-type n=1 Tax=Trema orientale TaxID=63057 RepID=A0A2P5E5U5_TREOI|nr:Zinc finger, RING-CH-type [Trema orientale]